MLMQFIFLKYKHWNFEGFIKSEVKVFVKDNCYVYTLNRVKEAKTVT